MAYNFTQLKDSFKSIEEWLQREFSSIRTGRATPVILDAVKVESYGTKMPISQVAGISIEGARMLRVSPWDASQAKAIEKAIIAADLGLSVASDDKGVRVTFPELTSERRTGLIKVAKQKLEEARVSVRTEREKVWDDIREKEESGALTEDDRFRLKNEMQKIVDEVNKRLEDLSEKKEKEILS